MKFTNQTFQNQDVLLDGNEFASCAFHKCRIIFLGIVSHSMTDMKITDCTWSFDGPAANTVHFMTALYAQSGDCKTLIEQTFENIRNGQRSTITH